jgi:hypothetical protein
VRLVWTMTNFSYFLSAILQTRAQSNACKDDKGSKEVLHYNDPKDNR